MGASIDMVVVNYKTYPVLHRFIDSYLEFTPITPSKLIIVDNEMNVTENFKLFDYQQFTDDLYVCSSTENLGYSKACNWGASCGNSKYIGLFNSDVEFVNSTAIDQCIAFMENHPNVGIVGPYQYSQQGGTRRVTNAGIFGPGDAPKHRGWREIDVGNYRENEQALMIMGSAMIIRRDLWNDIMNDEIFRKHYPDAEGAMIETPLYYEDTFLCYVAPRFGYQVWYLGEPGCELIHQYHQTIDVYGDGGKFKISRALFREILDDMEIAHD